MTTKQQFKIKSLIVDTKNCPNGIFPSFDSLNSEFSLGFRLIDNFSSYFSFHWANCKDKESKATYLHNIDNIFSNTSLDPKSVIIVSNTSIRNNVATYISHIHSHLNNVKKTIHHTVNVTSTEAKLFAIRYRINQAIQISEATHIIIIINTIHMAQCIFDSTVHSDQLQLIAIAKNLRSFFFKHSINSIKFWDCPSNDKWPHYWSVNKNMKKFNLTLIFPCKESWDFNKKEEYDNIIKNW